MSYTLGPPFGFLCLSKLSIVEELLKTNSMWNFKKVLMAIKNAIWINKPIVLMIVWTESDHSPFPMFMYSLISNGISVQKQKIKVRIMYIRNSMKNFLLENPTQLDIQGQWWSILSTHRWQVEQWWHLNKMVVTFQVWNYDTGDSTSFYDFNFLQRRSPSI